MRTEFKSLFKLDGFLHMRKTVRLLGALGQEHKMQNFKGEALL